MKSEPKDWMVQAAWEIDTILAKAVKKNTNERVGFFSGVSIRDIACIIEKHRAKQGK